MLINERLVKMGMENFSFEKLDSPKELGEPSAILNFNIKVFRAQNIPAVIKEYQMTI